MDVFGRVRAPRGRDGGRPALAATGTGEGPGCRGLARLRLERGGFGVFGIGGAGGRARRTGGEAGRRRVRPVTGMEAIPAAPVRPSSGWRPGCGPARTRYQRIDRCGGGFSGDSGGGSRLATAPVQGRFAPRLTGPGADSRQIANRPGRRSCGACGLSYRANRPLRSQQVARSPGRGLRAAARPRIQTVSGCR